MKEPKLPWTRSPGARRCSPPRCNHRTPQPPTWLPRQSAAPCGSSVSVVALAGWHRSSATTLRRPPAGCAGEPAGPVADHLVSGQPGTQRVRGVGLDADREGDGSVQMQGGPDARQRGDQAEAGLLRDADPPGPHLGRGRGGQDQQRPGPDGPPGRGPAGDRSATAGPVVRAGTGPRRPGSAARDASMGMAAMPVTTLPSWRAGAARRSARPGRRRPRRGWRGRRSRWRRSRCRCRCARRRRGRRRSRSSARPTSGSCDGSSGC